MRAAVALALLLVACSSLEAKRLAAEGLYKEQQRECFKQKEEKLVRDCVARVRAEWGGYVVTDTDGGAP